MSDDQLPMLPWYPRDFMSATRDWSLAERGVYRELLDVQWDRGFLPNNTKKLAELIGIGIDEFKAAWTPRVRRKFVSTGRQRIANARLEFHRAKALERLARYQRAGSAGGLASARKRCASDAQAMPQQPSTIVKHPEPEPEPEPEPSEEALLSVDNSSQFERSLTREKHSRVDTRGTRIPDTFEVSDDMRAWAQVYAPNVELNAATIEFANYWRSAPGKRGKKLRWDLTWQNRMLELEAVARRAPRLLDAAAGSERRVAVGTKYDRMIAGLNDDD